MQKKLETIKKVLQQIKQLDGWKISIVQNQKNNLYITKNFERESSLQSERINIEVTIYKKNGNQIGEASFAVLLDDFNEIEFKQKVMQELIICDHVLNKYYTLPSPEKISKEYKRINTADELFQNQEKVTEQLNLLVKQAEQELKKQKNIKLNSLEVLTDQNNHRIINSKGIDLEQTKTHIHFECTITAIKKDRENEYIFEKDTTHFKDISVNQIINENVVIVNDIVNAEKPKTVTGFIILSNHAVKEFFTPHLSLSPLIAHASARLKYMELSTYKKENVISQRPKADLLTIYSSPLLDCNPSSSIFDIDGVLSKSIILIENNKFKNYFASSRYAQYSGLEPTGALGSIEIKPGNTPLEKLYTEKKEAYEIISFASFTPNYISGDFSAEIRLGYKITSNNKKITKIPFRGGMFTGNVFSAITNITLAKETMMDDGYLGPKAVRFNEATIAGLED